ncbi:hypothetical protein A3Q56_05034 [Intoshia linei]|uniref:VLRF1 domain-containing protein n=1 Tax=Intoshia linei TaxID=1819745 RepID=A0A177AYX1_9BILA|nr:hypothetical protein A3Q56_05034 [Intoshia linei]
MKILTIYEISNLADKFECEKSDEKFKVSDTEYNSESSDDEFDGKGCLTCQITHETVDEMRVHFKSNWHIYNVKRRIKKRDPVKFANFDVETMETYHFSSDSHSEDEVVEKIEQLELDIKLKRILFRIDGMTYSFCKSLFTNMNFDSAINLIKNGFTNTKYVIILLISGGHCSMSIFDKLVTVKHKTFNRYVVRAKQGKEQSVHDKSKHAKSAGSQMRRLMSQLFKQDILQLLDLWSEYFKDAHVFTRFDRFKHKFVYQFLQVNTPNQHYKISIDARRPTFSETRRIFNILTTVVVFESTVLSKPAIKKTTSNIKAKPKRNSFCEFDKSDISDYEINENQGSIDNNITAIDNSNKPQDLPKSEVKPKLFSKSDKNRHKKNVKYNKKSKSKIIPQKLFHLNPQSLDSKSTLKINEKVRFDKLPLKEKMAIMAERRAMNQKGVLDKPDIVPEYCQKCNNKMLGVIPFSYIGINFCSEKCMKLFKKSTM